MIATIRVSFPLRVALAVSASVRSGPDQAPDRWKSGAERGAEIHVVVQVPDPLPVKTRDMTQVIARSLLSQRDAMHMAALRLQ